MRGWVGRSTAFLEVHNICAVVQTDCAAVGSWLHKHFAHGRVESAERAMSREGGRGSQPFWRQYEGAQSVVSKALSRSPNNHEMSGRGKGGKGLGKGGAKVRRWCQ